MSRLNKQEQLIIKAVFLLKLKTNYFSVIIFVPTSMLALSSLTR